MDYTIMINLELIVKFGGTTWYQIAHFPSNVFNQAYNFLRFEALSALIEPISNAPAMISKPLKVEFVDLAINMFNGEVIRVFSHNVVTQQPPLPLSVVASLFVDLPEEAAAAPVT